MYSINVLIKIFQTNHSFFNSSLHNIVQIVRAPWLGGFEYIPLTINVT